MKTEQKVQETLLAYEELSDKLFKLQDRLKENPIEIGGIKYTIQTCLNEAKIVETVISTLKWVRDNDEKELQLL
jgi:hypothetical protein